MTSEFEEDPLAIFTTDLYAAITTMRQNLLQVFVGSFEASDSDLLREVIFELCDELFYELLNYCYEMKVLHRMDILYWRRRNIFQNEALSSTREFLLEQFYQSLPVYPTHYINLCLVHDNEYLTPYFYLKRPVPSPHTITAVNQLIVKRDLKTGDVCFMIHRTWYEELLKHSSRSPPIYNFLSADASRMDAVSCDGYMFLSTPEWAWRHLLAWYGIVNCNLALKRYVVEGGYQDIEIECTPSDIWCFLYPDTNQFSSIRISARDCVNRAITKMKCVFDIPTQTEIRIYSNKQSGFHSYFSQDKEWTLIDGVKNKFSLSYSFILVVLPDKNGDWPTLKLDF